MTKNKRRQRPLKQIKYKFLILCEGDTEENYFNGMKQNSDSSVSLKITNMKGGCYKSFLEEIKKTSNSNYMAKFIIIDLDVLAKNPYEKTNFINLLQYCKNENQSKRIPIFVIINNPDFEYIACLHNPKFKGKNHLQFITNNLEYGDLSKFKNDKNIYYRY